MLGGNEIDHGNEDQFILISEQPKSVSTKRGKSTTRSGCDASGPIQRHRRGLHASKTLAPSLAVSITSGVTGSSAVESWRANPLYANG
jgi:hypothetical protein